MNIQKSEIPEFYQRYVEHVKDYPLLEALQVSSRRLQQIVSSISEELGAYAYAPGKWTIKELLTHMMDAERVFAYRALCFSRNDQTPLPGFDENAYVPQSNAHARSISEIARSMEVLRLSTIDLFVPCTPDMLKRFGSANASKISVEAIGYVIAGHEMHHCNILEERYLTRG
jgi:hypothetical protein